MVKRHLVSVVHAVSGVKYALSTQPNFLVHLFLSLSATILGIIVHLSYAEWSGLVLVITVGLVIELINTAIEAVVDLATDTWHRHAKIAKDTAAGAMLVYAIGAVIYAVVLFIPKIISL